MNKDQSYNSKTLYENINRRPIKLKRTNKSQQTEKKVRLDNHSLQTSNDMLQKQFYESHPFVKCNSSLLNANENTNVETSLKVGEYNTFKNHNFNSERHYTKAELAHKEVQKKRIQKQIETRASLTHRQRISKFNEKLASLPEHFDIPKVGPG